MILELSAAPLMMAWMGLSSSPASVLAISTSVPRNSPGAPAAQAGDPLARIPLSFEANRGQADPEVRFLCRGCSYTLLVKPSEAIFGLSAPVAEPRATGAPATRWTPTPPQSRFSIARMKFVGASPDARAVGLDEQRHKSNFFIGADPRGWRRGAPNYARVKIEGLYPGIDLIYRGDDGRLEYDLLLAPGTRPDSIRIAFEGVEDLAVARTGDLIVKTRQGELRQGSPLVYQEVEGRRRILAARYVRRGRREVGFHAAGYDPSRSLVIDPVLSYSTYLGGSNQDGGRAVAVDASGNIYVTGFTLSTNFPTQSPRQPANGGGADVFVMKLTASGSTLVYSTYLGGGGLDIGYAIAVDASGNAYVTGSTSSTNFPTQSPLQPTNAGGQDAFAAKLNPSGSSLVYSTYLGGTGTDSGRGISVDGSGSAYLTGTTSSDDFHTQNPLQPDNAGSEDAFVSKIHAQSFALVYSTYLGGQGVDQGLAIAMDGSGSAHVTGSTGSDDFPTSSPLQPEHGGADDGFVAKFDPGGSALVYSTYLGGSGIDSGIGIAVDAPGSAYVTGETGSPDFPVQNPFQPRLAGALDAFVSKLNSSGSAFLYSTYLGGQFNDEGCGIAVDGSGSATVSGDTQSPEFPKRGAFQAAYGGAQDVFVTKLDPSGSALAYSTFVGGSSYDAGYGMAVDGSGNAYFTGSTSSTNFPIRSAYQDTNSGGFSDAFVVRLAESLTPERLQADPSAGAGSDGNGVFEPGETAVVEPWWKNQTTAEVTMSTLASSLTGPAGATYSLLDDAASYGSIEPGTTTSCEATSDCHQVFVSRPAARPAHHWDATFTETPDVPAPPTVWTLHLGDSFADVPRAHSFYGFIETIFHHGITSGCSATAYCPEALVTRAQMAVFLLSAEHGPSFVAPPATGTVFADVPAGSFAAGFIERLAAEGITAGCGGGNYCPDMPVTRGQMAVFLLKTLLGSSYTPPAATGLFADVPPSHPFARWIEELSRRGITSGCGGGNYCPADASTRGQMAVFVNKAFGLE